ncbi:uncharacterized protein LOC126661689 [Mercurialis annua]|uniref:uncharacterized protein LOC126661689 n=1 Tax=Mercurialis annua TaxID=3986 RepID=UPI00215F3E6D|nr:uncharacterized protein LOC126661689 [Mercurialis annua]
MALQTAEQREFYFQEFQKEFWWDRPAYSEENEEDETEEYLLTQDIWDAWNAFWDSEKERKRSETARANRMSEPAGASSGPVRHTGGSRSALKHMDVMESQLGRRPSATELYTRLHSTKADKKPIENACWLGAKYVRVDCLFEFNKLEMDWEAITERLVAATQPQTGEGSSSSPAAVDETQVFLDIEGINKKKRVYGLGSASSRYAGISSTVQRGSSSMSSK